MKQLKLIPKTKRGQYSIAQHGNIWNIVEERENEFVLESVRRTFNFGENWVHDGRRVDKINDEHFLYKMINKKDQ